MHSYLNSLNTKTTTIYDVGHPGPDKGHAHKNVMSLDRVMGSSHSLLITGSPTIIHIYIYTHNKEPADLFHSSKPHTITKMNGNMNMNNTISGSMNAVYVLFDQASPIAYC